MIKWLKDKIRPTHKGWTVVNPTPQLPAGESGRREVPDDVLDTVFERVMMHYFQIKPMPCGYAVSTVMSGERTCIPARCAHNMVCPMLFARLELRKRMEGTWDESVPSMFPGLDRVERIGK